MEGNAASPLEELRGAYLDLLRNCLTGQIYDDPPLDWSGEGLRPFRASRSISERMYDIDGSGVFWQRGVA